MAGMNDTAQIRSPGPREDWEGPLGGFGWSVAWVDYWSYCTEKAIAATALMVMIGIEFIYILYQNATKMKFGYTRWSLGEEDAFPYSGVMLLAFVALLISAVVSHTGLGQTKAGEPRPLWVRSVISVLAVGAVVGLGAMCVWVEHSSTFYLLATFLVMGPAVFYFFMKGQNSVATLLAIFTVVLLGLSANVPEGYSWADKYSLFLMMWMGFLGASMTTREKGQIKLDVTRKFCPPKFLNAFNVVSDLIAAAFTGVFCYLGYLYIFREGAGIWYANTLEGEIPGWLVVLAIPLSLFIITARLVGRATATLLNPPPIEDDKDEPGEQSAEEVMA